MKKNIFLHHATLLSFLLLLSLWPVLHTYPIYLYGICAMAVFPLVGVVMLIAPAFKDVAHGKMILEDGKKTDYAYLLVSLWGVAFSYLYHSDMIKLWIFLLVLHLIEMFVTRRMTR